MADATKVECGLTIRETEPDQAVLFRLDPRAREEWERLSFTLERKHVLESEGMIGVGEFGVFQTGLDPVTTSDGLIAMKAGEKVHFQAVSWLAGDEDRYVAANEVNTDDHYVKFQKSGTTAVGSMDYDVPAGTLTGATLALGVVRNGSNSFVNIYVNSSDVVTEGGVDYIKLYYDSRIEIADDWVINNRMFISYSMKAFTDFFVAKIGASGLLRAIAYNVGDESVPIKVITMRIDTEA